MLAGPGQLAVTVEALTLCVGLVKLVEIHHVERLLERVQRQNPAHHARIVTVQKRAHACRTGQGVDLPAIISSGTTLRCKLTSCISPSDHSCLRRSASEQRCPCWMASWATSALKLRAIVSGVGIYRCPRRKRTLATATVNNGETTGCTRPSSTYPEHLSSNTSGRPARLGRRYLRNIPSTPTCGKSRTTEPRLPCRAWWSTPTRQVRR